MSRFMHGKPDGNQAAIVEALRRCGAQVCITSVVGRGFPDLVVGYRGVWYLLEIKDGAAKLNANEVEWHRAAKAPVHVVRSVDEAMRAVGMTAQITPTTSQQPRGDTR